MLKLKNGNHITIRRLRYKDLNNGFIETLRVLNPISLNPKMARTYFQKIQAENPNTFIYVALTDDNQVIGTASLIIDQKFGGKIGRLEDVATRKDFWGLGVSTTLQNVIISKAKELNCYKLVLNCKENFIEFYLEIKNEI